ncbi:hypothetical protein HBB16_13575 [Pseudonocardia sp. MCCB 268]|nr:hypothetical protein [Pseudonocardia cytotoxica]
MTETLVRMAAFLLKIPNQLTRIPAVRRYFDENGQKILDAKIRRVLAGHKAEYRGTAVDGQPTDQ